MIMSFTLSGKRTLLVPIIAVGILIGGREIVLAQSALFTNIESIASGTASTTVPPSGASVTRNFATGDSYFINSAGNTDASVKDGGQGIGADIRLSIAGNGIRLVSNQNTVFNTASDTYTFYNTITDVQSGRSGVLFTTFQLNTTFNTGNSLTAATLIAFGSIQNGALAGNSIVLGNNTYAASNFAFTPPSAPSQSGGTSATDGAFSEHITAMNTVNVPEPGAVATMVGMGVGGTLLIRRRRK